jgi:DNA-binding XRE family transcriptional regulator
MHPDKPNTFLCQYDKASGEDYYIFLNFNSIQAAKAAAHELLAFLGEDVTQPPAPAEAPPHKTSEENTPDPDPLTTIQEKDKEISNLLRDYRAAHGYSQRKMAELLGTSQANICNWEHGVTIPNIYIQERIKRTLESGEFNV